jgi:hypothetical protein
MAIQVSSITELQQVMMDLVGEAMDDTADWVIEETKKMVDKEVYDAYDPEVYHRTNYLRDSIDVVDLSRSSRHYSMTIGHDKDGLDWWSISEHTINYVPTIVTYGRVGTYVGYGDDQFGNRRYHNIDPKGKSYGRPRPYMDRTVEALKSGNNYLNKVVANLGGCVTVGKGGE